MFFLNIKNNLVKTKLLGGVGSNVMVTMLASSVVDHGFEFWSGQKIKLLGGGGNNVMVTMLASSVVDHGFNSRSCQRTKEHRCWW